MSLEPLDRKRKYESSESLGGSVVRWRGSSSHHQHHRPHPFNRPGNFRRMAGHRRQDNWQTFPEESSQEHMLSRPCDKNLEEDNCRSRGDGKYGRGYKESRGAFSQREWKGRPWESPSNSLSMSRRQTNAFNERKSGDDMLTYPPHPNSGSLSTWEQHHMKDQRDKMGGINRFGTGPRYDRDSSLGTVDWKPLKWTRPGSVRDSSFSQSSGTRSLGGANSKGNYEGKYGLQPKIATAVESNSREAAICRTSSAPSEEANSKKKPRLNWGEGLAKFEKKHVEGPEVTSNKDGAVSPPFNMEPSNFLCPSLVSKNTKVSELSGSASPAAPTTAARSSSPGADDKLFGKAANMDSDVGNLSSSPDRGSQNHLQMFSLNLEKVDIDSLTSLGSSLVKLPQSEDLSSVDYNLSRSTTMNELLILKAGISKVLEVTETEIDSLENEHRSLKSESEGRFPCSAAVGSLLCYNGKPCSDDKVSCLESSPIVSSDNLIVEKVPIATNFVNMHDNCQEDDTNSHGPARSKVVEPLPIINAVSSCDVRRYGSGSEDLGGIQSKAMQCLIPCTNRHAANVSVCGTSNSFLEVKDGVGAKKSASLHSRTEDNLYEKIISCNKKSAKAAHEVFAKLLPETCRKDGKVGASTGSCSQNDTLIMEKFAEKRRLTRLRERVMTLKYTALHHFWKEDMRLLSIRKQRPKSHKKLEASYSHQKKRSSISFRFPFPAGNQQRLVPTSELIKYTSQLLSESKHEIHRSTLKMPALILDQKDKMNSMFLSSNGLVEDPLAIEKERAVINPWTSEERNIFLKKFAAFGKDFRKIATFLDHKTTADCVEFYYKNHKSDCFEKIKKKDNDKLKKFYKAKTDLMPNTSSLDILSAASVMADDIARNRRMRSGRALWRGYNMTARVKGFGVLQDERETVAADVLTSICGSVLSEATSSCITSSVNPVKGKRARKCVKAKPLRKPSPPPTPEITQTIDHETCSDESCGEVDLTDWTDVEKAAFLHAVSSFGKDFAMIARCVRTRSQYHCKVFFSKTQKRLRLNLMGHRPENVGSLGDDDADGGRSGTDIACIVETGSANGSDTSGTKTGVDQPAADKNMCRDESNPVKASNMSADLDGSEETNGKVDHEDVNMISNVCVVGGESNLDIDGNVGVLYDSDRSGSVRAQDEPSEGGVAVIELVSGMEIIEPCYPISVGDDRLVSDVSSGQQGNELEGSTICLVDRDEADTDVVVQLKDNLHDTSTLVNTSLSSLEVSCSRLTVDAGNEPQLRLEKSPFSGTSEGPLTNANSTLQYTAAAAVQHKKTTSQDTPSSSNLGYQLCNPGNSLDRVEAVHECYNLQVHSKKEMNVNMSCSGSATELPLLSQKIEQHEHYKSVQCLSDSEEAPRNDVKIFGKILTIPSSTQKPNLGVKGNDENGTHHPKLNSASSSLKLTSHANAGGKIPILEVDLNDCHVIENVPVVSYINGNKIQPGSSSLPDSAILLAKYPAAFGSYPITSKLEQESLQALAKNDNQHLDRASAFTTREVNGSNDVLGYHISGEREDLNAQPLIVDDLPRRDGFEAISSLQQHVTKMVGTNAVQKPGILVGGSTSAVSDPVAAIRIQHSLANQFVGQSGSVIEEGESLAGEEDMCS
ncbi:uncharacterized protein LOC127126546 isoform X2 [Lathyrus oleraceus]|uniref:SANT domain-containing protein n=1 Tax=Pisum sativum TaxID=3888 RepID=A0A9D5BHI7_PEA|nr:uncharacterized protein LOC127126546 isoform X2 [Pisum sativum]KAI5443804.1 hypothetical protein KIW84_012449 [Pisum sativum]